MAQEVAKKLPVEASKAKALAEAEAELSKNVTNFLRGYTPSGNGESQIDIVANRFKIDFATPLPDFNTKNATAYMAKEIDGVDKEYMALICEVSVMQRANIIKPIINSPHPNLLALIAGEVVQLSKLQEERFVLIYEKPKGAKLSVLIAASKTSPNFDFICQYIISPIAKVVNHLNELGIVHGNINTENIYFDTKSNIGAVVGQCVVEPCGSLQPFYYEPVERIQANEMGKGEGDSAIDYYAMAVVILQVIYGMKHFNGLSEDMLIKNIFKAGAFTALTRQKDMPEFFFDFFRGLLSHNAYDRWNYRYLKAWLDGKRYNVMPTPPPQEAIRPFEFGNDTAYTRKGVAHLFFQNWNDVPETFASGQLSTWVAISLRNKELNEYVLRTAKLITASTKKNDIHVQEQIMRAIAVFDPFGPIRFVNLSFHIEGINTLFADVVQKQSEEEIRLLMQFIELSMFHFAMEQRKKETSTRIIEEEDNTAQDVVMAKLDRLRSIIRNKGIGFGYERILYDLNPNMRCISPKLSGHHVSSLSQMLKTLDKMAPRMMNDDPIDRHIAAFIASHLNIQHEIFLTSLTTHPTLAASDAMMALKLLAAAQHKTGVSYLPGITNWLALRILPLLDVIRSRTLKMKLIGMLENAARSGNIRKMADVFIESGYAQAEVSAFQQATRNFRQNSADIIYYTKKEMINIHSQQLGAKMAHNLSMAALVFSFVLAIKGYF